MALKSLTSITRCPPSLMKASLPSRSRTLMQSVELARTLPVKDSRSRRFSNAMSRSRKARTRSVASEQMFNSPAIRPLSS